MRAKIDQKEITKLIDLMEERNLTHFELETEGFKVSIGRNQPTAAPVVAVGPVPAAAGKEEAEPASAEEQDDELHYITSPMVGTFYRAPDPSSPAFVEIGETVHKDQTLCIIEAMKLMNEIEADTDGVIEEVFIKNGKPVEYGQKLFSLRPQ